MTIILAGDACRRVLANFVDRGKLASHLSDVDCSNPVEFCIQTPAAVGALRLAIVRRNLAISVREFPVDAIVDHRSGSPDLQKMCKIAVGASGEACTTSIDDLVEFVVIELESCGDKARLCSGHDFGRCVAALARKCWKGSASAKTLMSALRAAFSFEDLASTEMYRKIRAWGNLRGMVLWGR